jgi:hypothetical protein
MKLKLICFNSNRRLSAIVFSEASKVYCKMISRFKALSTVNVMRPRIVVKTNNEKNRFVNILIFRIVNNLLLVILKALFPIALFLIKKSGLQRCQPFRNLAASNYFRAW